MRSHDLQAHPQTLSRRSHGLLEQADAFDTATVKAQSGASTSALKIEQGRVCIGSRLSTPRCVEAWLDKVFAEQARVSHLVPKLDQSILAKAFRGELVPQDPNDELASELLERIAGIRSGASIGEVRRGKNPLDKA